MIPLICSADAYTISSNEFISPSAREKSVYNFTNRYSPTVVDNWEGLAQDSRMVFWGLSQYIRTYLNTPITADDVLATLEFMNSAHSFGGKMNFDVNMWMRVVREYGGYLPIRIEALPEGSVFFPGEPVVQVSSVGQGFGDIAALVESRLVGMISIGSASATLNRLWRKKLQDDGCPKEVLDWFIHDFSSRACSSESQDILCGIGHLLSFNGTDNFAAAYYGRINGIPTPIGTSIHALAHRNVQSFDKEVDAFNAIMDASSQKIASYVADCYNFNTAVDQITDMARHFTDQTFVIRPDSGNHKEVISTIIEVCKAKGLFTTNEDGKLAPKNVRFIYGDSVTPSKMDECLDVVDNLTGNRFGWGIFGVGGFLVNNCTRDTLSSAYKLSSVGNERKPVVKLSETSGKLSVPGPAYIYNTNYECEPRVSLGKGETFNSLYMAYYDASKYHIERIGTPVTWFENLNNVVKRTRDDFTRWDNSCKKNPNFGLNRTSLTNEIKAVQDEYYTKYRT